MALVPMDEGIVGSINKLEQRSPTAAEALVQFGLYEALADCVDAHREPVTKMLRQAASREVSKAQDAARRMGNKELIATLEEVSKELVGYDLTLFNQRVNRDKSGRFARQSSGGSSGDDSDGAKSPKRDKAPKRGAKAELNRALRGGLINEDSKVQVSYTDADGKSHKGESMSVSAARERMGEQGVKIENISVPRDQSNAPKGSNDQAAIFDLAGMATDPTRANRLSRAMTGEDGRIDAAAAGRAGDKFTRASDGNDRRAYRQMQMLGDTLRNTTDPGTELNLAGSVASLAGRLGPEAERVLGPGMRRTAYRYRGTERRPDENLRVASQRTQSELSSLMESSEGDVGALEAQAANRYVVPERATRNPQQAASGRGPRVDSEIGGVLLNAIQSHKPDMVRGPNDELPDSRHSKTGSTDSIAMQARGDAVTANLIGALRGSRSVLPDQQQLKISQRSGSQPPSHGVIIDAEGNLVTQAHGFNGDHYLPFDLKNLKALRGGQYVRTRATGGPTTEDVYTGLMAGARQFQVASNTGVFTVQFDPSLRGSRRFSDKSRKMVDRYGQILETIADRDNENGLMAQDFSPEDKQEMRDKAMRASSTPQEFSQNLRRLENQARFALMANDTYEQVQETVRNRLQAELASGDLSRPQLAQRKTDVEHEVLDQIRAEQPAQMTLNGEGYKAALETLQAEFPYAIRDVGYEPLREWAQQRQLRPMDGLPGVGASVRSDSGYRSSSDIDSELRRGYKSRSEREGPATPGQKPAAGAEGAGANGAAAQPSQAATSSSSDAGSTSQASIDTQARKSIKRELFSASNVLHGTAHGLEGMEKAVRDNDTEWLEQAREEAYQKYVIGRVSLSDSPNSTLTDIVMEATPKEEGKLRELFSDSGGLEGSFEAEGANQQRAQAQLDTALNLKHALNPMREDSDLTADIPERNARPPKVEGLDPAADPDKLEQQIAQMKLEDNAVGTAIDDIEVNLRNDEDKDYAQALRNLDFDDMTDKDKAAYSTAWAFLASRDASKTLHSLKSQGGGTPKGRDSELTKRAGPSRRSTSAGTPPDDDLREFLSDVAKRVEQLQNG